MIDLSKIAAKEIPTKTVTVNILGTITETTIRPLTGQNRMDYWALDVGDDIAKCTKERVFISLKNGAGMKMEDIFQLIVLDWDAAVSLAGNIHTFTVEFEEEISKIKKEAEKNFQAAGGKTTPA